MRKTTLRGRAEDGRCALEGDPGPRRVSSRKVVFSPGGLRRRSSNSASAPFRPSAFPGRPTPSVRAASRRSARRSCPERPTGSCSSTATPARSRRASSRRTARSAWSRTVRSTDTSRTSCRPIPAFFRRLESLYPGRDFTIPKDGLHEHGTSSIKYGRGAVLTIDLTNRCNMMCNPCFMDANQVGYVHELEWEDVKKLLDDAVSIKPRRQLSVQFSGGEPTLSPHFLPAIRYARELGYFSVQCATNGVRFAQDADFAREAGEAGLRFAYLQFDGVGNENNQHRKVGNLYDVKLRAIENLKKHGVDITLVTTIVNSVNNDQVGDILRFAIENIDKINAVAFQPVSFTGRDEDIDDETRKRQRYTLSHLAHDVKTQAGIGEPMRDWYPAFGVGPLLGPEGPAGRARVGVGLVQVRLPSQLRHRHDAARRREDQGDGHGAGVSGRGPDARRHQGHHRLRAREDLDGPADGPRGAAEPAPGRHSRVAVALEGHPDHGRPHGRPARLRPARTATPGASSSSAGCGSRTSSTTTSGAPRCASSRTRRRWGRSPSARTTRVWAGARSSRRCSRRRRWPSGTRRRADTRSTRAAAACLCRCCPARPFRSCSPLPAEPARPAIAAAGMLPVYGGGVGR